MPEEKLDPKDEQNIDLKDLFKISKWVLNLVFTTEPLAATGYVLTKIYRETKDILNSYIFAKLLDVLIQVAQQPHPNIAEIYPYLSLMIGLQAITLVVGYLQNISRSYLSTSASPKIRQLLYKKLNSLGVQTLEQPEINNKIFRANDALSNLQNYFINLIQLVANLAKIIISASIVFSFAPYIIVVLILVKIPFYFFDKKYRGLVWKFMRDNTEGQRKASNSASDLTSSKELHEVSINGAFEFLNQKYQQFYNTYIKERLKIQKTWLKGLYILGVPSDIIIYVGYIIVISKLLAKQITLGTLTFQIRSLDSLSNYMDGTLEILNEITGASYQIKDTYSIFNTEPIFEDGITELPILNVGPEIDFENVGFKYPNAEKFIYESLNLKIKSGEKIAIVGHNGAGKTTLVKLICRFYKTTEGELLINKFKIDDLKIGSLYRNMGVLLQDYNTYPQLTARENILIGNPSVEINEDKIIDAAKNADALNFIEDFPNKFDQILSEKYKGGTRPSTGQWQKIAIARFFYRNAPLVIFDEPTAAIDAISEYNIFNKIYEFFVGKTVIIISHRFSTVRNADRIIVIEHGKIIEEGSHKELMEMNGYYAKSFKLQAEGYSN